MTAKKKITHVVADLSGNRTYFQSIHASEDAAIASAKRSIASYPNRSYGVFELTTMVVPKAVPVEVTRVKNCIPCKEK